MTKYEVVNNNHQTCGHKHKTADTAEKSYKSQPASFAAILTIIIMGIIANAGRRQPPQDGITA